MSCCECSRNETDCPVCELYQMMYMKDYRTWDCPTTEDLDELIEAYVKRRFTEAGKTETPLGQSC